MIGSDIYTEIASVLGNRTDLATRIERGIKLAKSVLEKKDFLPWFLVTPLANTVTITSDERVKVPTDFIRELDEVGDLWVVDSSGQRHALVKQDYDILRAEFGNAAPGFPEYYALTGDYFRLFPIPDAVYALQMLYYAKDIVETNTSTESKWGANAPELLISLGGFYTARALRSKEAMQIFRATVEEELLTLQVTDEARRQANLSLWVGMYGNNYETM